jgi:hypothetical protein
VISPAISVVAKEKRSSTMLVVPQAVAKCVT